MEPNKAAAEDVSVIQTHEPDHASHDSGLHGLEEKDSSEKTIKGAEFTID